MAASFRIEDPTAVARLDMMTAAEIDALPVGVIGLDAAGRITRCNRHEAARTGLCEEAILGRDFQTGLAPWGSDPDFKTLFEEGLAHRQLDVIMGWSFDADRRSHAVLVRLARSQIGDGVWIMIERL